jgi:hypothetical protein
MKLIAQSARSASDCFHVGSVALLPVPGPADPADDNLDVETRRSHIQRARNEAGTDYQPAESRMWWLP